MPRYQGHDTGYSTLFDVPLSEVIDAFHAFSRDILCFQRCGICGRC